MIIIKFCKARLKNGWLKFLKMQGKIFCLTYSNLKYSWFISGFSFFVCWWHMASLLFARIESTSKFYKNSITIYYRWCAVIIPWMNQKLALIFEVYFKINSSVSLLPKGYTKIQSGLNFCTCTSYDW